MHHKNTPLILLATSILVWSTAAAAADDTTAGKNYSSVEERRLESSIMDERANLRKEREEIALRKKELKTLEEGVDKKLAQMDLKLQELQSMQKKIEELLKEKSAADKQRTENLARIYAKMSPAKAALALSGLDEKLAADLLASMKVKAAAKILDQVSKLKASELSTTFSTLQLE
jgi:flagellar motility protein MotE (MotC chaperone)